MSLINNLLNQLQQRDPEPPRDPLFAYTDHERSINRRLWLHALAIFIPVIIGSVIYVVLKHKTAESGKAVGPELLANASSRETATPLQSQSIRQPGFPLSEKSQQIAEQARKLEEKLHDIEQNIAEHKKVPNRYQTIDKNPRSDVDFESVTPVQSSMNLHQAFKSMLEEAFPRNIIDEQPTAEVSPLTTAVAAFSININPRPPVEPEVGMVGPLDANAKYIPQSTQEPGLPPTQTVIETVPKENLLEVPSDQTPNTKNDRSLQDIKAIQEKSLANNKDIQEAYQVSRKNDYEKANIQTAINLIRQAELEKAKYFIQDLLLDQPDNIEYRKLLARAYLLQQDFRSSLAVLEKDRPAVISDQDYHALLALSFQKNNQSQQALSTYHALLRINPSQPQWLVGLAMTYDQGEQWQEAQQAYQLARQKSHQLNPGTRQYINRRLATLNQQLLNQKTQKSDD